MGYDDIEPFHGHNCPGLAIGYRMALAAMENHLRNVAGRFCCISSAENAVAAARQCWQN